MDPNIPAHLGALLTACLIKRYLFLDGLLQTLAPPPQCPAAIWTATDQMTQDIRRTVVPQELNPNPTPPTNVPEAWSDYVESARRKIFAQGVDKITAMVFIDWCCRLVAKTIRTSPHRSDGSNLYRTYIVQAFSKGIEEDVLPWLRALYDDFAAPRRRPAAGPVRTNNTNRARRETETYSIRDYFTIIFRIVIPIFIRDSITMFIFFQLYILFFRLFM